MYILCKSFVKHYLRNDNHPVITNNPYSACDYTICHQQLVKQSKVYYVLLHLYNKYSRKPYKSKERRDLCHFSIFDLYAFCTQVLVYFSPSLTYINIVFKKRYSTLSLFYNSGTPFFLAKRKKGQTFIWAYHCNHYPDNKLTSYKTYISITVISYFFTFISI